MSLGPVGNNSQLQQTRVAELAKKEPAKVEAQQATTTPDEVAKAPVSQDAKDAAREIQDAIGKAIQQKLELVPAESLEARARKTGPRGKKSMAQGPVRGLATDDVG